MRGDYGTKKVITNGMNHEETQPRRTDIFPEDDHYDGDSGPGCLVWGIMGLIGIIFAIAIVAVVTLAGFNEGISIGKTTAIALTNQYMQVECSQLPTDIAMNRVEIVQQRYTKWQESGGIPACAVSFVPQATQIYLQSLATDTPMPTFTPIATATEIPQATPMPSATSNGGYDLGQLFTEAQTYLNQENYEEAIRTLEAIQAIDSNYQSDKVNSLLFNALFQWAKIQYRSEDGSLAEGIYLTNRAEQFGDISNTELNFERSVAQLYLDAQAFEDINYSQAISLLSQVIQLSTNYPRGTGQARQELLTQYIHYGDALLQGADPCNAVQQYNSALQLSPNRVDVQTNRDTAQTQCSLGVVGTTDPNATVNPFLTPSPAPVGVGG